MVVVLPLYSPSTHHTLPVTVNPSFTTREKILSKSEWSPVLSCLTFLLNGMGSTLDRKRQSMTLHYRSYWDHAGRSSLINTNGPTKLTVCQVYTLNTLSETRRGIVRIGDLPDL